MSRELVDLSFSRHQLAVQMANDILPFEIFEIIKAYEEGFSAGMDALVAKYEGVQFVPEEDIDDLTAELRDKNLLLDAAYRARQGIIDQILHSGRDS